MVELAGRRLGRPAVQVTLRRAFTGSQLPLGLTSCLVVGGLAFANGGYFPVSWGWSGLALLSLAAIGLALGVAVEVGVLGWLFFGALAGLTVWISLSLLWTSSVPGTVLEVERMLVYLAAGIAGLVLVRRSSVPALLLGVWAAITVVSTYALATRLFPERLGVFDDPVSVYRLSHPVGYWNAFGILAAIGTLLALGLAARSGPVVRCFAAGSGVLLLLTLYFTYSRGGWIAFFIGLAATIAIDRKRLQLITTALVLAPWPVLAIWVASTSPALTRAGAALTAASHDGHGLAVIAIALVVAAALAILVLDWLEAAVSIPHGLQRVYAGTLIFILVASLIVVFGRYGFPPTLARKTYDAFNAPPRQGENLNSRLFSLSSNGRTQQFHTAWQQVTDHPVLGGGAGSYDQYWFQHRRVPFTVHDAHNLYLETLAELGAPGLLLLALVLGVPLAAVRRARSSPLAAVACGAFIAYLAHAFVDWDWEMPAVTIAALFCGLALLAAARSQDEPKPLRPPARLTGLAVTAALAGFVLLGLLGNSAVSASSKSTEARHFKRAQSQARLATKFAPWSSEPWRKLGEAQTLAGDLAAARASYRKAIAKDPRDWSLWYELAGASGGAARERALAEASRLNPLSPEIADVRKAQSR
jgi:hypothetical protein